MNERRTRTIRLFMYLLFAAVAAVMVFVRESHRVLMALLAVYCLFMAWFNSCKLQRFRDEAETGTEDDLAEREEQKNEGEE